MSLAEKIRKARHQVVEIGGFKFTIRRPTDLEMIEMRGVVPASRLFPFIIGWDGVKAMDIIPGGDPHPAPFDEDTCEEWLADRPDLLGPLANAIMDAYRVHVKALEGAEKN